MGGSGPVCPLCVLCGLRHRAVFLWTFWDGSGIIGMPDGGNQKISGSSGSAIALLCVWYEYAFAFSKQVRRGRQRRQGPAATARGAPLYPRHTAAAGPARGFVTPGAGVSLPPPRRPHASLE